MAEENVVKTNIVATSNMSNLISDLNKVTTSLSNLQQTLNATNKQLAISAAAMSKQFADTLRSTGQFSTHFVSLTSDVDKFGQQLDKGQLKLGQFFRVYQDQVRGSGGLIKQLAQQQVQLQNAILQPLGKNAQGLMQYNVHIPTGLDKVKNATALARQELAIMNKVVQEGAGQLINWGKNTQWAGRQLTVGLTVPLAAFGKAAADAFRMADQELVRLTKVYGGLSATSAAELAKVRKDVAQTAAELSKGYGASFAETISLAADIAATGKQGNELLGSIKETTRLAVLGEVDRQEAMKATLAIQTAFKQNTQELSDSINFLNAVENQTSTTLQDLVEAIPKAGPIIKGLGGSVQDLALYLTAMREGGVSAAEGANALKSALGSLINPTQVATKMFAGFGIDLKNIVAKNAGNVTGTILELQSALDKLDPLQKQQALEQLFGKFQFARMNALFSNLGKQGSQTLQVMDLMKASSQELASVASRELSQVTESASGKYRRALEGLKADLAGIGESFLKINTTLINVIDKVINFAQNLPGPIKSILSLMGMLTAVAGPIIMLTGVLGNFFGYIIKGIYHFKSFFKGAEGWKLLTPEILAANKASSMIEKSMYSDAKAAAVLNQALQPLISSYARLTQQMSAGVIPLNPGFVTPGGTIATPGRQVNPGSPYITPADTRHFAHMNPVSMMTSTQKAQQSIFGIVPGPQTVNQRISNIPQVYMTEDLPRIQGITAAGKVSTGVVAGEAAKFHAMTGALGMQTQSEIAKLRTEVARTGLITDELAQSYQTLLPQMQDITANAAARTRQIVAELQANKITADQARAQIITLNREIEAMMVSAAQQTAASLGRNINVTQLPMLNQPAFDPRTGKSNMKELFRQKRGTRQLLNNIASLLGVKTYGASYSIETTIPKKMWAGGQITGSRGNYGNVYNPNQHGAIVPGPNVNYDIIPANVPVGGFVLNQAASRANPDLVNLAVQGYNAGGQMTPAVLTPGETVIDPLTYMANKELFDRANSTKMSLGGKINRNKKGYGNSLLANLQKGHLSSDLSAFMVYMDTDTNQRMRRDIDLYKGFNGITGREIAESLTTLKVRTGMHPMSILNETIKRMGGDTRYLDILYRNLLKDLVSRENVNKVFGTKSGASFEALAEKHLFILKNAKLPNGSNVYDELKKVKTIRSAGKSIGLSYNDQKYMKGNSLVDINGKPIARSLLGTSGGFKGSIIDKLFSFSMGPNPERRGASIESHGRTNTFLGMPLERTARGWAMSGTKARLRSEAMRIGLFRNKGGEIGGTISRTRRNYGITPIMGMPGVGLQNAAIGGHDIMPGRGGAFRAFLPSMIGNLVGYQLGSSLTGGNMLGGIAGSMAADAAISKLMMSTGAATKNVSLLSRSIGLLSALPGPVKVVGAALALFAAVKSINDKIEEHRKIINQGFAPTEDTISKLNLKFTSLKSTLDQAKARMDALRESGGQLYSSRTSAGIPGINLTIKQLDELKKSVKKDLPDLVDVFNKARPDEVVSKAEQLKAQFISGGMSAQNATNIIYALISQSNDANLALKAIASEGFLGIKDAATAASSSVKTFVDLLSAGNTNQISSALDQLVNSLTAAENKLIGTKDKQLGIVDAGEAFKVSLQKIKDLTGEQDQLGIQQLDTLKSQNIVLSAILSDSETLASVYSKIKLYTMGISINFKEINPAQAEMLATAVAAADATLRSSQGKFGSLVKAINSAKEATKANSVATLKSLDKQKTAIQDQIELRQKEIDLIKKTADERRNALDQEISDSNYLTEIKKKQLEYQEALASGDFAAAAKAQLDIQQLTGQQQVELAKRAITEKENKDIAVKQAEIDRLQNQLKGLDQKVAKANDAAAAATKKVGELEGLLNDAITAVFMSQGGYTKQEKGSIDKIKESLTSAGYNDIAALIGYEKNKGGKSTGEILAESILRVNVQNWDEFRTIWTKGGTGFSGTGLYLNPGATKKDVSSYKNLQEAANAVGGGAYQSQRYSLPNGMVVETFSYKGKNYAYPVGSPFEIYAWDETNKKIVGSKIKNPQKLNIGGQVRHYGPGGDVNGPGTSTSDSIPAMLSDGEYVIRASSVDKYGKEFFDELNAQKFADGGMIIGKRKNPIEQIASSIVGFFQNSKDVTKNYSSITPTISSYNPDSNKAKADKEATKNWYESNNYYLDYMGNWKKRGPSQWSKYTTLKNWKDAFNINAPTGEIYNDIQSKLLTLTMGPDATNRYRRGQDIGGGEIAQAISNVALAKLPIGRMASKIGLDKAISPTLNMLKNTRSVLAATASETFNKAKNTIPLFKDFNPFAIFGPTYHENALKPIEIFDKNLLFPNLTNKLINQGVLPKTFSQQQYGSVIDALNQSVRAGGGIERGIGGIPKSPSIIYSRQPNALYINTPQQLSKSLAMASLPTVPGFWKSLARSLTPRMERVYKNPESEAFVNKFRPTNFRWLKGYFKKISGASKAYLNPNQDNPAFWRFGEGLHMPDLMLRSTQYGPQRHRHATISTLLHELGHRDLDLFGNIDELTSFLAKKGVKWPDQGSVHEFYADLFAHRAQNTLVKSLTDKYGFLQSRWTQGLGYGLHYPSGGIGSTEFKDQLKNNLFDLVQSGLNTRSHQVTFPWFQTHSVLSRSFARGTTSTQSDMYGVISQIFKKYNISNYRDKNYKNNLLKLAKDFGFEIETETIAKATKQNKLKTFISMYPELNKIAEVAGKGALISLNDIFQGNNYAGGGYISPKYNIPTPSTTMVNPMPMGYNRGGTIHRYDVGGLVLNPPPGTDNREIATMVVSMLESQNLQNMAKIGGKERHMAQ